MNWWNSSPQQAGPSQAINQSLQTFDERLVNFPWNMFGNCSSLDNHPCVNPPNNLAAVLSAGGEGDIYRIIISEYPVSGLSSYLSINITNDNVVTTCGWDWDTERTHNNYETLAHTNVIPAVKQRKDFQLKLIRSKNQDNILSIVTSMEGLWAKELHE